MGLTVVTSQAQREAERAAATMHADRRLWLTAAKDQVVEDGDVRAAFLFAPPGGEILPAEAARFGLTVTDGRVVLPEGGAADT